MVSVKSSFLSPPFSRKPITYHSIASKHLQKQFVHSCVCTFLVCYAISFVIGERMTIILLFPWTWTGLRAIALFLAIISIALVRKANLKVEHCPRGSLLETIYRRFFGVHTCRTLAAYLFSTHVITMIYLRNCSKRHALTLLLSHHSYELPRVNERWLFIHVFSVYMAVISSILHIWHEVDVIQVTSVGRQNTILRDLQASPQTIAGRAALGSILVTVSSPIIYVLFIRHALLRFATACVRLVYTLPKTSSSVAWPIDASLIVNLFVLSFIVMTLWISLNMFFTIYISQGPVRKNRLLSERSLQPMETLIDGLSQQQINLTQLLALEELRILTSENNSTHRRVEIFEAGDPEAVAWRQVVDACLKIIDQSSNNLESGKSVQVNSERANSSASQSSVQAAQEARSPGAVKVSQTNIFRAGPPKRSPLEQLKSAQTSTHDNQSQINQAIQASESTKKYLSSQVNTWTANFAKQVPTSLPPYFRTKYGKLLPNASRQTTAALCLLDLLKWSVTEDTFGRVHKDVKSILSRLNGLRTCLQSCCDGADIDVPKTQVAATRQLISTLEVSISSVGIIFEDYVDLAPELINLCAITEQYKDYLAYVEARQSAHTTI